MKFRASGSYGKQIPTAGQLWACNCREWYVEYLQKYPQVELDIFLADRKMDLISDGRHDQAAEFGQAAEATRAELKALL